MRHLGFIITFLGLLELFSAAPDREKRQVDDIFLDRCQELYNVSCAEIGTGTTSPPLKTDIPVNSEDDCECVAYFQCYINGTMNTDGLTIIDRRISKCSGSVDVCCKPVFRKPVTDGGSTGTTPLPSPTPTPTPTISPWPTPSPSPSPSPTPSPTPRPRPTPPPIYVPVKPGCGHRNPGGISVRITGSDNEAQFAEFPWMVAVMQKPLPPGTTTNSYTCGGSLIHPRAILTAAHSVENKRASDLIVRAGEWDTQTISEPLPHQEREVEAIIMHERYNTNNLHWDFAILILKTPFDVAPNVNVICLPEESDLFDAVRCTATGWGKDKFEDAAKLQVVLKRIELPVVPQRPCQTNLRKTKLGKAFELNESFLCAGGEPGIDTCTGDGGSPLACPLANSQDRYVQSGIVAWGISCGADRTPGVYASVAKARRWIDSKMAQYNLDTSSYIA